MFSTDTSALVLQFPWLVKVRRIQRIVFNAEQRGDGLRDIVIQFLRAMVSPALCPLPTQVSILRFDWKVFHTLLV
jgi:hypothetical protein